MRSHRIAAIPGDGIGKEVVGAARQALDAVARLDGFSLAWESFEWGCEHYQHTGAMMPPDGLETLSGFEAIFLGAVGFPGVPDHVSLWGLLIPIRREFEQYVNLRPIRLLPGLESPLRPRPGPIDFMVVRENNEGEYSEIGGRLYRGAPRELAVQAAVFTRDGVDRVVRYAFELARTRDRRLTSATKSNGIVHTMPFWDQMVDEIAPAFPEVAVQRQHVDALAAMLVLRPETFDVVVASNLFGDILTDLGAAIVGSIGIAPSANLNPQREYPSMFEPVHGSAPDIAGRGIANPLGQIWAGVMMLEHLGEERAARRLMGAVERVLAVGGARTPDLGGSATTGQLVEQVLAALEPDD